MERTSSRWQIWMEPVKAAHDHMELGREKEQQEPRPGFILWIAGGKTLYDGEMIGMADLNFYHGNDAVNSFNIAVQSPSEALELITHITGSWMLGLVELEEDGEYHEWYDEEHNEDIERLSRILFPDKE